MMGGVGRNRNRRSQPPSTWLKRALCGLCLFAWMIGDGGSAAFSAPANLAIGHPPLPAVQTPERLKRLLARGYSRSVVVAAGEMFAEDPADVRNATLLISAARQSGRMDWLEAFSLAAKRRVPTAAVYYLIAETRFARQGFAAGVEIAATAHARLPSDPSITVSYAAGLAATGRPLEAYGLIGRWSGDRRVLAALDELSLRRLATLTAAVAPYGLGGRLTARWLQKAWLSSDPAMRARGLVLASSLIDSSNEVGASIGLARQALSLAARAGDPTSAAISVIHAAGLSARGAGILTRSGAACHGLPHFDSVARADCLLAALENASGRGDVSLAMRKFEQLSALARPNPLLDIRLGVSAVPVLRILGERARAAEIASRAAAAAGQLGRDRLAATFYTTLSEIQRTIGDHSGAYDSALQALALLGANDDGLLRQASAAAARAALARGDDQAAAELLDNFPGLLESPPILSSSELVGMPPGPAPHLVGPQSILAIALQAVSLEEDGRFSRALDRYGDAIALFDRLRVNVGANVMRTVLLNDVWQDVTRRAIRLALLAGDAPLAVGLLEHSRARSITDATDLAWVRRLPRGTTAVAFVVVQDSVFAVVIDRDEATAIRLPTTAALLRSQVAMWRSLAQSSTEAQIWSSLTDGLIDVLFGTIETVGLLDDTEMLYVVPDDVLHLLPFAGLSAGRRRDYIIAQVSSLSDLKNTLARMPAQGPVVAFGPSGGSDTIAEMRSVGIAGGATLLGPRATESAWRRRVGEASVVHFGGHSLAPTGPGEGLLQLRGDASFDGALTLAEILDLQLSGATVVLLACDTATRPDHQGTAGYYSQIPSLGEAFIVAGARSVVGNLWPITEQDARILADAFYRAGGPARGVGALEEARLELRSRWPELPRRWAGAVWLGAASPGERLNPS